MNRDIDRPAAVRNWLFSVYIPDATKTVSPFCEASIPV